MTVSELNNHIQAIKCKYALFTNKLALSLQYGIGNLDCLETTAWIVKSYIGVLERFSNDGKLCTTSTCSLTNTNWIISHICGYFTAPYTTYTCTWNFATPSVNGSEYINAVVQFNTNNTLLITRADGSTLSGTYTFLGSNLIITSGSFLTPLTVTFSPDCNNINAVYNNGNVNVTIYMYAISSNNSCDWAEYCITEAQAEDIVKDAYKRLGNQCNC